MNRNNYFKPVSEITLKFVNEDDYNRFVDMLGLGILEAFDISNQYSCDEKKKYFVSYTSIIKQLPTQAIEG